jgi:antitoxin component of RelBE/YafQ-DinJ toxin-antitoxin module
MNKTVVFNCRIDIATHDKIESICREHGMTRSQFLRESLRHSISYFEAQHAIPDDDDMPEALPGNPFE